jgi:hypothetical protein
MTGVRYRARTRTSHQQRRQQRVGQRTRGTRARARRLGRPRHSRAADERPQREGRPVHQQRRRHQQQEHELRELSADLRGSPHGEAAAQGDQRHRGPSGEGHQAPPRPAPPGRPNGPHGGDVGPEQQAEQHQHQGVRTPLDEQPGQGQRLHRRRGPEAGAVAGHRPDGDHRHRRRCAGQGDRQAERRRHHGELDAGEGQERSWPARGQRGQHPAAVLPAEGAEQHQGDRLDQEQHPVPGQPGP